MYLFYQSSLIDKKTFAVPLEVISNGLVVPVGDLPSVIILSVRAGENDIKSVFPTDIKASINLNNVVASGTYRIPIDITISDKLMGFDPLEVKLKEEKLKIVVERKISNFIKVVPSIVGEVAENYEINDITMDPSYIQIEGPESVVNSISEIKTGKVNVSNAKIPFTVETYLDDICDLVEVLDKKPCKATISVRPKLEEKVFSNIPIRVYNLSDNIEIVSRIPLFSITLRGNIYDFDDFNISKYPGKINLYGIEKSGEYNVPIHISIPDKFNIIGKSIETVSVKVKEKKKVEEKPEPDNDDADKQNELENTNEAAEPDENKNVASLDKDVLDKNNDKKESEDNDKSNKVQQ